MGAYDFGVTAVALQDIDDPDEDEDEDSEDEFDDDDDADEDDEEDEDVETWQVSVWIPTAKGPAALDFGRRTP